MATSLSPRMQLLLHAPVPVMLSRLAVPNVAAIVMMTAITFADAWYVAHLGTAALASFALAFPFQTLMQMMSAGAIGGGVTSALARALGSGDMIKAEGVAWHAVIIGAVMSLLYMVVLGLFSRPIFALLGGTGEALNGAVTYARIIFGGAPTIWLVFVLSAILRGTGDTATPARAVIVSSIVQIILSGALTLGWGRFPALGSAGPATAMIVCQGLAALYLVVYVLRGNTRVRLRPQTPRWKLIKDIMQVGGMGLVNSTCMAITVVIVTGFVGRHGTEALAGYGLGSRLELMIVPVAFGIGGALTAAVGTNVGAGQYARARRIAWTGSGVTFVLTGVLGIAAAWMPGIWLDRFTPDPEAYAFGALYLSIAAPLYGLFGGGQTLYFASQGTGRMLLPVMVTFVRFLVVVGIGAAAVAFAWSVSAVFAAVGAGLAIIGIGQALCLLGPGWQPQPSSSVLG